ncbi:MAG TPA: tetratricopeptide repeat protein [Flavobacteriales bacterium]|nr:tetratricopeptide repeat protein [Flavobacteriales bacterium]HNM70247.1 tetratricopeptide repeat protein [Flavobacteriales bacterium]HNO05144.1 tetratricopeptide repeat protein [Flavobacteriales bacterium]
MHRLLAALLLLRVLLAHGQDASLVPDLRATLATATNDTLRADALARICFNLIRSEPDSARLAGEQAMTLAKRIGNQRALGDAHNNLGWLAAEQGQLDRADSLLRIALGIFQKIGVPAYTSVTLSNLGWLAEKRGDSVGALKRFQEALTLSEAAKDTATVSILLYSIGTSYRKIKDHEQAVLYLERSQAYERLLHRPGKEAHCLVALANTLKERGDTLGAIDRYHEAIAIYKRIPDHLGWGIAEENLGDLFQLRSPRTALEHYGIALAKYDSLESTIDQAYVLQRIGKARLELGDVVGAGSSLNRGLELSSSAGDPALTMEYEMALARLAAKNGDAQHTMSHFDRYLVLKDSIQGADTQRELARLRTEFETERKEKDNIILRAENSEQAARIRSGQVKLYASIALVVLVLVAALLLLRNFLQKQKHANVLEKLNQQLADSNKEVTEINGLLEMKLLRSQMNPHFIYNCLNSAAQMTQAGKQVVALAYLQGFARLLRMVLDHSVNDTVSVEEEVDFLLQYLKLEAHRLPDFTYDVNAAPDLLDDGAIIPALIIQPFVENAVWHGLAHKVGDRSITVHFTQGSDGPVCTVTDNGIGRKEATSAHHAQDPSHKSLGMQLTSERLKLMARRMQRDGSITIEDLQAPDGSAAGTRVTVVLR